MALIPLIFNNNDTDTIKTKIGKVPAMMGRAMNAYSFYNKCGIFKNYGKDCKPSIIEQKIQSSTISIGKGIVSVYGGVMLIEDNTPFSFSHEAGETGYIVVSVDLSKDAGLEAQLVAKKSGINNDNLQANETSGKFDFILYKYVVGNDGRLSTIEYYNQFTQTSGTPSFIYDMNAVVADLENKILLAKEEVSNGNIIAKQAEKAQKIIYTTEAPTVSPENGTLIVYIGTTLPTTRYERVLYLVY